jgi:hypothetical protein
VIALAVTVAACATHRDTGGATRIGVGLWGFGDPPVDWNLDWPRRGLPEFPPATYPELTPSRVPPADLPAPRAPAPIDDNRTRAQGRDPAVDDIAPTAGASRRADIDHRGDFRR